MGYADYLKRMLSPLGVYRLDRGYSKAELDAIGDALDKVSAEFDAHLGGFTYGEISGEYLEKLESLLPIVNFGETEEERRQNVLTLLAVNDGCSDKESLEAILKACGLEAEITEESDKFTAKLYFKNIRGELSEQEEKICREIMPSHIALNFVCDGLTWDRAEELFPTWDDFDNAGLTASELVKLK